MSILTAAELAEAAVAQQSGEPKGLIKITAGSEFGTMIVDRWIAEFLHRAPKVIVEAEYTNCGGGGGGWGPGGGGLIDWREGGGGWGGGCRLRAEMGKNGWRDGIASAVWGM